MRDVLGWVLLHPDEALTFAALIMAAVGAINRWAIANKRDRLANFTAALGRAAGRVNLALQSVPANTTVDDFRSQLIRQEAMAQMAEWATTARKVGATVDKTASIIEGELGKIVGDAVVAAAAVVRPTAADPGLAYRLGTAGVPLPGASRFTECVNAPLGEPGR